MIRITKALLEKFHRGECTTEEHAAVCEWMQNTEAATQMSDEDRMTDMEARIWKAIEPKEPTFGIQKAPAYRTLYYGIAASLLLTLGLGWLNTMRNGGIPQEQTVYMLDSDQQKKIEVRGLDFTLANNSNAVVVTPLAGQQGGISFCGAVQITNNSGADIEYVFESACKKSAYTRKKVTFKSGTTYIAVHNFYKTDEVIVMKKENLVEFPDAISSEVMNEFSI